MPGEGSNDLERWKDVNYMVTSWMLNSISKEIVEGFLYTSSLSQLWTEIQESYGETNEPLIYQLRREIISYNKEI